MVFECHWGSWLVALNLPSVGVLVIPGDVELYDLSLHVGLFKGNYMNYGRGTSKSMGGSQNIGYLLWWYHKINLKNDVTIGIFFYGIKKFPYNYQI